MKLKKIIVTAFLGVLMLLTCFIAVEKDSEQLYEEMPDIVFVAAFSSHYQSEAGTAGYYIEKSGVVKYFHLDENKMFSCDFSKLPAERVALNHSTTIEDFSLICGISEFHEEIQKNSISHDMVDSESVISCYRTLLRIDENKSLYHPMFVPCMLVDDYRCYGVRFNDNNEEEYILIKESSNLWYENTDEYAKRLYEQLSIVYPEMSWWEMKNNTPKTIN